MQEVATSSSVKKISGRFTHTVVGWSILPRNVGDHIESPVVDLCGYKWQLRIFPGGSMVKHDRYLSLYLANRSSTMVMASYKLFILNQSDEDENVSFTSVGVKKFETQGSNKVDGWGRDRFIDSNLLSQPNNGLLVDDRIIFAVEITVFGTLAHSVDYSSCTSTLDQDMLNLYFASATADFTVIVVTHAVLSSRDSSSTSGRSDYYKVHRAILAARSPVFRAMLTTSEMREQRTNSLIIEDADAVAVEIFLKFLYSDYCSDKDLNEYKDELFVLGSKYQVPLLVTLCEQCIMENLSLENIIHYYFFADHYCGGTYNPEDVVSVPGRQLIVAVNNFMADHFDEITSNVVECNGRRSNEASEFASLTLEQQQYILSHVSDTPGKCLNNMWYRHLCLTDTSKQKLSSSVAGAAPLKNGRGANGNNNSCVVM